MICGALSASAIGCRALAPPLLIWRQRSAYTSKSRTTHKPILKVNLGLESFLGFALLLFFLKFESAHYASASTATGLTLRLLCIRSKNEPSFEKTLTGLGSFAAGFMGATGTPMGYG